MFSQGDSQTSFSLALNNLKDVLGRSRQEDGNSRLVSITPPAGPFGEPTAKLDCRTEGHSGAL